MEFGVGFGPKRPGEEQFGAQGLPQPLGPLDLLFCGGGGSLPTSETGAERWWRPGTGTGRQNLAVLCLVDLGGRTLYAMP